MPRAATKAPDHLASKRTGAKQKPPAGSRPAGPKSAEPNPSHLNCRPIHVWRAPSRHKSPWARTAPRTQVRPEPGPAPGRHRGQGPTVMNGTRGPAARQCCTRNHRLGPIRATSMRPCAPKPAPGGTYPRQPNAGQPAGGNCAGSPARGVHCAGEQRKRQWQPVQQRGERGEARTVQKRFRWQGAKWTERDLKNWNKG